MKYTYSIIIPCYKETKEDFKRCLDSIKNQTKAPDEVICIDDCSPIDTPKMAIEYGYKYIRHKENLHNGGARNSGIKIATGDYLVFVNADDYILPNELEEIDRVNSGQDLIIIGFQAHGHWEHTFIPTKDDVPFITKYGWNGEPMHVVKRSFILDNNLFEQEKVAFADIEWSKRVETAAKTFTFVPKALYQFNTSNPNSITSQVSRGEM